MNTHVHYMRQPLDCYWHKFWFFVAGCLLLFFVLGRIKNAWIITALENYKRFLYTVAANAAAIVAVCHYHSGWRKAITMRLRCMWDQLQAFFSRSEWNSENDPLEIHSAKLISNHYKMYYVKGLKAAASGWWKIGDEEEKWVQVDHFQRQLASNGSPITAADLHVLTAHGNATFFTAHLHRMLAVDETNVNSEESALALLSDFIHNDYDTLFFVRLHHRLHLLTPMGK